jgi:hypothetical protein
MNKESYTQAKKELAELNAIDWENDAEANNNVEYIDHRMKCLQADIFGYEHAQETGTNPYEEML